MLCLSKRGLNSLKPCAKINPSTLFLACVWFKQQKGPKEKGSLDGGPLLAREEGGVLGIHTLPISLRVFLSSEQGAHFPVQREEYRENTCLMCHRALTVQDQVFMAGSSIGSCLSQRACSSLKANNHRGILENYTQSKLLL